MAPICYVRTEGAHEDCVHYTSPWWEHPASLLPKHKCPSTTHKDTTMDSDYQYRGLGLGGNTRFSAYHDRSAAVGTSTFIVYLAMIVVPTFCCRPNFDLSFCHNIFLAFYFCRYNPLGNLNSGRRPWAKLIISASLQRVFDAAIAKLLCLLVSRCFYKAICVCFYDNVELRLMRCISKKRLLTVTRWRHRKVFNCYVCFLYTIR